MQVTDTAPQRNNPRSPTTTAEPPPGQAPASRPPATGAKAPAAPAAEVSLTPEAKTAAGAATGKSDRGGAVPDRRRGGRRSGDRELAGEGGEAAQQAPELPPDPITQAWRKRVLQSCEGVLAFDYESLVLNDYPDNEALALARRRRDLWLSTLAVSVTLAVAGLYGWLPAWVGGSATGATVLVGLLGWSRLRRALGVGPSVADIRDARKQVEFRALNHIRRLEGNQGLVWRCTEMARIHPALGRPMFAGLVRLSRQGKLVSALKTRAHIRLYLQFLVEAERAYRKLQDAFVREHRAALARGEVSDEDTSSTG